MMPSRTRVVDTLIGLLVLTVVALTVVPWLVPGVQEAARNKPDPDLVLTAVKKHQAVLDAEQTNPKASAEITPPMQAELMIRDAREQLTQDGIPVTSATSKIRRIRATYQSNGNVHVITEVSTSRTCAGVSSTTSVDTNRHTLTLTGNDNHGCSMVSDETVDLTRPSPPIDIQHRADLVGLGMSIMLVSITVVTVALPWRDRACLPRGFTRLPFGGAFALMIGIAWDYTVGNMGIRGDDEEAVSCLRERMTSLDSQLIPSLNRDCMTQGRVDVLAALLAAVTIVPIEYRILLSLRQTTGNANLLDKP